MNELRKLGGYALWYGGIGVGGYHFATALIPYFGAMTAFMIYMPCLVVGLVVAQKTGARDNILNVFKKGDE